MKERERREGNEEGWEEEGWMRGKVERRMTDDALEFLCRVAQGWRGGKNYHRKSDKVTRGGCEAKRAEE